MNNFTVLGPLSEKKIDFQRSDSRRIEKENKLSGASMPIEWILTTWVKDTWRIN